MNTRKLVWLAIALVMALAAPGFVAAQTAPGLGRAQPNAPDVSASPQFHVYRWTLAGISYVQVNDTVGNPLLAYAAQNGQVLVLPVGNPSNVAVVSAAGNGSSAGAVVYQAADTTITQAINGTFNVSSTPGTTSTAAPAAQTMMICQDPAECSNAASP